MVTLKSVGYAQASVLLCHLFLLDSLYWNERIHVDFRHSAGQHQDYQGTMFSTGYVYPLDRKSYLRLLQLLRLYHSSGVAEELLLMLYLLLLPIRTVLFSCKRVFINKNMQYTHIPLKFPLRVQSCVSIVVS